MMSVMAPTTCQHTLNAFRYAQILVLTQFSSAWHTRIPEIAKLLGLCFLNLSEIKQASKAGAS